MLGRRTLESFVSWAVAGFLAVGVLTSLPVFIVPLLVIALVFAARRYGFGAGTSGLLAGVGLASVGIGIINLGNRPCPAGPMVLAPGQLGSVECGGPIGAPWLIAGIMAFVAAVALLIVFERLHAQRGVR